LLFGVLAVWGAMQFEVLIEGLERPFIGELIYFPVGRHVPRCLGYWFHLGHLIGACACLPDLKSLYNAVKSSKKSYLRNYCIRII
jgi:hypothetical protein